MILRMDHHMRTDSLASHDKVAEITEKPVKYVCEICGHTVVLPSPEGFPNVLPFRGRFYHCDVCKKVVCRDCTGKGKSSILCKKCVSGS